MSYKTKWVLFASLGLLMLVFLACGLINSEGNNKVKTVENVDLNKYMGVWYEIARFDHRFERGLVGVTATYTLREDGKITVLNKGYKNSLNGKLKQTRGKARVPDKSQPGKLKVTFFIFGADYFILELDTLNYQYSLVGSSSMNYLWILGRSPQMDDKTYSMLIEKAKARGYKTEDLIKVEQNPV